MRPTPRIMRRMVKVICTREPPDPRFVLEPFEPVVRGFQRLVGHHQYVDALLELDLRNFRALFVEQEGGHVHGYLAQHGGRVVLHGLFLDDAQYL